MQEHSRHHLLLFALLVMALQGGFFLYGNYQADVAFKKMQMEKEKLQAVLDKIPLEARAVSVYDIENNEKIYCRNDTVPLPIASLTKLMTALVAMELREAAGEVEVSFSAVRQPGSYGFRAGDRFKLEDLAKFTLIGSSNDGAYALAEGVPNFLEKMNEKARKIGMEQASFSNPTGLDVDAGAGAFATASDINMLSIYSLLAYPEIFSATVLPEITIESSAGLHYSVKNTNTVLERIPNLLFSKTGLTPKAGGNLSVVFRNGKGGRVAITVLGSTEAGRFTDVEKIVNALISS